MPTAVVADQQGALNLQVGGVIGCEGVGGFALTLPMLGINLFSCGHIRRIFHRTVRSTPGRLCTNRVIRRRLPSSLSASRAQP